MAHSALSHTDFERYLLALTAWREDSEGGRDGMLAVMLVIRNRFLAGMGGKDGYSGVIEAKNQFDAIVVRGDASTVRWPRRSDSSWVVAMSLVDLVYSEDPDSGDTHSPVIEDITKGATMYWNPQTSPHDGWFARNIARNPARWLKCASIGGHDFYSEIVGRPTKLAPTAKV